jgi:hypothetical protein
VGSDLDFGSNFACCSPEECEIGWLYVVVVCGLRCSIRWREHERAGDKCNRRWRFIGDEKMGRCF